jgi:hypothetical protein
MAAPIKWLRVSDLLSSPYRIALKGVRQAACDKRRAA